MNYSEAMTGGNPYSVYMLFTYSLPIALLALYPVITLAATELNKRSALVLDFVSLSGLMGFCAVLYIYSLGADSSEGIQELLESIIGQIGFILMVGTSVIIPFLTNIKSRCHAAASILFGGKPPLALLGRSLL
jgi:hypothetical protein